MKTKTLLLAGLVCAASAVSSMAQVYSVNVVGFVNVTCPAGFSMISNPLVGSVNTVAGLFGNQAPAGTHVFKFDPTTLTFTDNRYLSSWRDTTMTLNPGEGVFVQNNSGAPFTITFVGTVNTGALSLGIPAGFSIVSSQTPQSGLLDDTTANGLNFPLASGDHFYFLNASGGYDGYRLLGSNWHAPDGSVGGLGSSQSPPIAIGQSFWVQKAVSATWSRNFATQ